MSRLRVRRIGDVGLESAFVSFNSKGPLGVQWALLRWLKLVRDCHMMRPVAIDDRGNLVRVIRSTSMVVRPLAVESNVGAGLWQPAVFAASSRSLPHLVLFSVASIPG